MAGHRVIPAALACLTFNVWFAAGCSSPPTESSGPNIREESVTFQSGDLHLDGLAGVALLQHRRDIEASDIGVWGLSQGGWLGPLAASRSRDVRFVIAVSGPAVSPGEQMVFYYANQLHAEGVPDQDVQKVTALRRLVWNAAYAGRDLARARTQLDEARRMASDEHMRAQLDDLVQALRRPAGLWIMQEILLDDADWLLVRVSR
jgi:hypothetical protein